MMKSPTVILSLIKRNESRVSNSESSSIPKIFVEILKSLAICSIAGRIEFKVTMITSVEINFTLMIYD